MQAEESSISEEENKDDETSVPDSETSSVSTSNDSFFDAKTEKDLTLPEFNEHETQSKRK